MACVINNNCSTDNRLVLSTKSHGLKVGFCETHNDAAVGMYSQIAPQEMLDDYVLLQLIMVSKELFVKVMKDFTSEVSRAAKSKAGVSRFNKDLIAMSLNRALWRYEQLCWFGEQKKIMSGLLSFEEFKASITNGYMVKDPGPGPDHGEFSHRLQWQYIMRIVTNRFTVPKAPDWNFTPLELYSGMFKVGNVWGTMLEGQQMSLDRPGSPTWVNKQFQGEGALSGTSFGNALTGRYNKRQSMVASVRASLQEMYPGPTYEISVTEAQKDNPVKPNRINAHAVIEYLYKWKKAGCPATKPAIQEPDKEWKKAFLQRTLDAAWHLWHNDPNRYKSTRTPEPQYRRAALDDDLGQGISDGLLLHKSERVTDSPFEERINNSKASLNTDFKYSKTVGAAKLL